MSAKKTEILKLEKSSRVKKRFGNSSEDKVILSFAAAFAILAVFFIVMETSDEKISSQVKQTPQDIIINEKKITDTVTTVEEDKAAEVEEDKAVVVEEDKAAEVEEDKAAVVEEDKTTELEDLDENNPKFDLVRVEEDGSAIIAGSAMPNSEVRLLVDGKELEVVEADGSGTFAILTTIPTGEKPIELQLEDANDKSVKSKDTVLVIPNKETENKSPKIVIAETSGEIIVQEQNETAPQIQSLSLDTINYTASGDVVLAGRAASEQTVRIYVDNEPVVLGEVNNGKWNFEIPNIEEGIYTLRVDALNKEGEVVDRVESPFQRVILEMERGQATIQPGFTLWKLAELKYGFGMRYVQIFEANRDSIKDPDLIYPGQVFQIPEK